MPTYIAFLRAINVGGRFAKMADLRAGLIHQGFAEVESFIQSGNLRLTSDLGSVTEVENALESALAEICGFTVSTIVRTPEQLGKLTSYGIGLAAPFDADHELHAWNMRSIAAFADGRTLNVWAAWGTLIRKRKYLPQLLTDIVALPELANVQWLSRGPRSKAGHPHHPLYVRADALLDAFDVSAYLATL